MASLPDDKKPKRLSSLAMVWGHARRYPAQLAGAAAALVVAAAATSGVPYAFKLIIDRGFGGSHTVALPPGARPGHGPRRADALFLDLAFDDDVTGPRRDGGNLGSMLPNQRQQHQSKHGHRLSRRLGERLTQAGKSEKRSPRPN